MQERSGGMLTPWWEAHTNAFMNSEDFEASLQELGKEIQNKYNVDPFEPVQEQPLLVLGHDTRESSPRLHEAIRLGAEAVGVKCVDFGLVTTP